MRRRWKRGRLQLRRRPLSGTRRGGASATSTPSSPLSPALPSRPLLWWKTATPRGWSPRRASSRTTSCSSSCRWKATWTRRNWRRSVLSWTILHILAVRWGSLINTKTVIVLKGGGYLWGECGCHSPGSHHPRSVQTLSLCFIWLTHLLSTVVHLCQDGLPHHQWQESRPRQGLWGEKHLAHLVMALTKVKRRSGMMTRATFLLNKERKVCFSASYPRWVSSIWLRTLWTSRNISIQVCGKEPQGDGEAGGRRQGVGLHRGEEECERVSFSCSSS